MRAPRMLLVTLLFGGALVAAACDSSDDSSDEPEAAQVTFVEGATDAAGFSCVLDVDDEVEFAAGEVPLELVNESEENAEFRVNTPDGEAAQQIEVPAGESVNEVFDLDAGEYTVSCTALGEGAEVVDAEGTITVGAGS